MHSEQRPELPDSQSESLQLGVVGLDAVQQLRELLCRGSAVVLQGLGQRAAVPDGLLDEPESRFEGGQECQAAASVAAPDLQLEINKYARRGIL